MTIIPQTQSFKLYGAGASTGDTSITLQSFKNLDGTNLTMAHFGGTKGYLTIEPNASTQEEQVSFTGITNNANGTVTLTGIKNVLDYTPFTETSGLAKTHGGNVEVIVSNTSGFYNNIIAGTTASEIENVPAGNIAATDVQAAINELDTEKVGLAGTQTITGRKTFTETEMPRIDTQHSYVLGEEEFLATKRYVDGVAGTAAVANASTTVKGIVEEATDAEVLASTTTGGTGARLYVNPGSVGNAANKIPILDSTGKLPTAQVPNLKFGGTGADGALSITSGATNINLGGAQVFVKNYTSISITGTGYLTFTNPHANGTNIIFKSQGNVTITSSATNAIDLRSLGGAGGAPAGGVDSGRGGASIINNGNASGVGSGTTPTNDTYTLNDYKITRPVGGSSGIKAHNFISLYTKNIEIGPGTGGQGGDAQGSGTGYGGNGAGALYIECAGAFSCSGTINASGTPGSNGLNRAMGGGGGGSILILYNTLTSNTGTYNISGGTGGICINNSPSFDGGAGGAGYSYVGLNTEFV